MAQVAHKLIPDVDLHEPKGVVSATAGQVYVSDGLGSGVWQTPTPVIPLIFSHRSKGSIVPPFTIQLVPSVFSSLLNYANYESFSQIFNLVLDNNLNIDGDGNFLITTKGLYEVSVSLSYSNTLNNEEIGISLYKNQADVNNLTGTVPNDFTVMRSRQKTATDILTTSYTQTVALDVSDVLGVAMGALSTGDVIVTDGSFNIKLLQELP